MSLDSDPSLKLISMRMWIPILSAYADFDPVLAELRMDGEDEDDYGKSPKKDGDSDDDGPQNAWEYCF